jgi:hypothetical protein
MNAETPRAFPKGLWGRRIFGRVVRDEEFTLFELELTSTEGETMGIRIFASNIDLSYYPELYGEILDNMTDELERVWKAHTAPLN